MKGPAFDRRTFIKSGGVTLALPFLESLLPASARAAVVDPKRYICMYLASGTYIKANDGAYWYPGTTAGPLNSSNLPLVFQPFAANAADFSIVRGLDNQARYQCVGTGGDHSTAVATYLTCSPYTDGAAAGCTIAGSSFDRQIASKAGLTAYALSAGGNDGYHADSTPFDYSRTVSYVNGQQADCWLNPYKLFGSLFAGVNQSQPGPPANLAALARNKSILDNALGALNKLRTKLGVVDGHRLDDYLTGFRALEKTVQGLGTSNACTVTAPPDVSLNNEDHSGDGTDFPARLKAFCDIMILAFKCNNAQVFSFMFEYENTNRRFVGRIPPNLVYNNADMGNPGSHNEIAHWADGGSGEYAERSARCVTRDRFYMSQVVYLINALKAATDASGSPILDNTIIQFGHGLHDGNHGTDGQSTTTGLPLVLAGGKNLIHPGNFYYYPTADLKDLYYSINRAMGIGLSNFQGSSKLLNF